MEKRLLIAGILSFLVIVIFHFLYLKFYPPKPVNLKTSSSSPKLSKSRMSYQNKTKTLKETSLKISPSQIKLYKIFTDDYNSILTSLGSRFLSFKLKKYFLDLEKKHPVEMITSPKNDPPFEIYLANDTSLALLNFKGPEQKEYFLNQRNKTTLVFRAKKGKLLIEKDFTFKKDSYFIDAVVKITNFSDKPLRDRLLIRGVFSPFAKQARYSFKGPFYYTDHLVEVKLRKGFAEYSGPCKFMGYQDTYFMVSLIPMKFTNSSFYLTFRTLAPNTDEFILWTPEFSIPPQGSFTFPFKIYIGPKSIDEMGKEYPLLKKALYFGMFDLIAKPLLYVLKFFNKYTHNYGWAIVIVTILLRILFFPLNQLSYKSMQKMKELQPIIESLRKKYKDDPQRLNKEIMNLYKTHKINPFSGCLPILIQIPVFIAFYKVLLMAIELRHAPFILWIKDLSAPERLYIPGVHIPLLGGIPVLTILMGLSMYVQQKLTPSATTDPFQQRLMLLMPLFFTVLFINFPSGLVVYWFVNNVLSIAQQYLTLKIHKT